MKDSFLVRIAGYWNHLEKYVIFYFLAQSRLSNANQANRSLDLHYIKFQVTHLTV